MNFTNDHFIHLLGFAFLAVMIYYFRCTCRCMGGRVRNMMNVREMVQDARVHAVTNQMGQDARGMGQPCNCCPNCRFRGCGCCPNCL